MPAPDETAYQDLAHRHYENFPVASWLLPRPLRAPVAAIYAFARSADDIADEGNLTSRERLAQLDTYASHLHVIERGGVPREPLFHLLADNIARHRLPTAPFHDLLSAFRQDVEQTRYADIEQVLDYCRRSANPIGRLLLHLFRINDPNAYQESDSICTGLQLVNFLQDTHQDYARGRIYIPQTVLTAHGVSEQQFTATRADAAWQSMMRAEIARTRAILHSGRGLVARLPGRLSWELRFTLAGGLRVLDKLAACNQIGTISRARLGPWDWFILSARALRQP